MKAKPLIALIDPGMGNLRSVRKAWEFVGAEVRIITEASQVASPDALVFPGQGGMPHCMEALRQGGFDSLIKNWIAADKPFFGICLGLQALFEYAEEGSVKALGIFPGIVRKFALPPAYKIPHMGWNAVRFVKPDAPMQEGLAREGEQFYFVHSYHVETKRNDLIWGETEYAYRFTSAISIGKCYATQFHPEKSQQKGLQIYRNFMTLL